MLHGDNVPGFYGYVCRRRELRIIYNLESRTGSRTIRLLAVNSHMAGIGDHIEAAGSTYCLYEVELRIGWIREIAGLHHQAYNRGVKLIGEVDGTFRISTRVAPHNLYGDTAGLRATADNRSYSDEFGTAIYDIARFVY